MPAEKTQVIEFSKLVLGSEFARNMRSVFCENPGKASFYSILSTFLQKLFYNIYGIPNLPKNKIIIIKPETLFAKIPSCNVILPCMRSSTSFSKNFKSEPTRMLLETDPLSVLSGVSQNWIWKPMMISAVDGVTDSKTKILKSGNVDGMTTVMNELDLSEPRKITTCPLYFPSKYEDAYGINIVEFEGYNEVTAFLLATSENKAENAMKDLACKTTAALCKYALLHQKYLTRSGLIECYFNPYITPGFPMASLEKQGDEPDPNNNTSGNEATYDALNIFGYVTNVVHSFSPTGWHTSVEYTAGHFSGEAYPDNLPVVEDEYTDDSVGNTYKNILGDKCESYTREEITEKFKDNLDAEETIGNVYKKIARGATTLDSYLQNIAEGSSVTVDGNVMVLTGSYFRTEVQDIIKKYSKKALNDKKAFSFGDYR